MLEVKLIKKADCESNNFPSRKGGVICAYRMT